MESAVILMERVRKPQLGRFAQGNFPLRFLSSAPVFACLDRGFPPSRAPFCHVLTLLILFPPHYAPKIRLFLRLLPSRLRPLHFCILPSSILSLLPSSPLFWWPPPTAASTCPAKYVVNKTITSFALLVFQLWFGFSGVLGGNQWEILSAFGLGFLLCAFAASRLFGNLPTIMLYDVIMFVGVVFCQFACSIVLPWLLKEHKWRLYRKVGTDIHLRSMYFRYLVLLCLLKSLLLLAIINGTSSGLNIQDKTGTIALDVMHWVTTLTFVVLGGLSFRFEWRAALFIALFLGLYAPAYVIYWFYEIISTKQVDSTIYVKRALAISFLTTGALTLIIQPISMILLSLQYRLFDTGFKTIFDEQYTTIASTITPAQTLYVYVPNAFFLATQLLFS